ncbi:amino acid carrier protein [Candidatus Bandiella euplotis]|uniref:Amino acid carrier protein n=1 Tax=Candidatus Bandiella euplotis TaxID=1664265 RepID=A0ABZ0UJB0_9RICK|nr:amino acid carrier protein [Candidatus Bandiella woodruffii]WPX96189.1 Putative amino acid carrier protein [Candidatus Bandiella woodruffii]
MLENFAVLKVLMQWGFWDYMTFLDGVLWNCLGLVLILSAGIYLTIYSKFFQIRALFKTVAHMKDLSVCADKNKQGTHPFKLYFASIGGMIGLGNLVTVVSVVTIGGPGSLVWLWIASFLGMLVKYSEIYLGVKYRVKNDHGGFDGGPMYYLKVAFNNKLLPILVCILLCIYGAEVSQFLILTDTLTHTFSFNRYVVIGFLLFFVLLTAVGGVKRFANVCSIMMPPFMIVYVAIGVWVILDHFAELPAIASLIFSSFFDVKSQAGGMLAGGMIVAAHYGMSRAVYSGDIGIGYDSIIQSETQTVHPEKQARMAIFALFSDSLICTISIMILLVTGLWKVHGLQPSEYVASALRLYIPKAEYFMAALFVLAGFTTITGYLVVGQKCARYLHPKYGTKAYILYSIFAFIFFSFYNQEQVILVMSVSGGLLMLINILGVLKLRKSIKFL